MLNPNLFAQVSLANIQTIGVPRTLGGPRYMSNLATFVPRAGAWFFIVPRESSTLIFGGGEVWRQRYFAASVLHSTWHLVTVPGGPRTFSHLCNPLLRVLPRHQPEPYIRRRDSHASSARHICIAAHLLFLLLSFCFFCFLSCAALVALSRTS